MKAGRAEGAPIAASLPRTPTPRESGKREALAQPPPRIALTRAEAAAALGVSVDFFDEHVLGELRVIRRGRRVMVAVAELERWAERAAARTL